jgi:RHS repeat-associated protein
MGARTLNYNLNNRLIQVVEGTVLADYVYNGLGQRIKKIVNETTTIYHYDRFGNLIGESDGLGNFGNKYIYLSENRLSYVGPSEDIYYFVNDHLGTPQRIMDQNSNVVWSADYQPFGQANITVSTLPNNFRLPGQYYDQETGLNYNYFRYYSPGIGRYLRPDPIGLFGGINLYAYVFNNPISLTDPLGLRPLTDCEKKMLSPYIPQEDLDNADLHDGEVPWYLGSNFIAVTRGNDIYFRPGVYDPSISEGLALLGHELVHVGQYT